MSQGQPVHHRQSTHIAVAVMALSALFTTVQIQAADDDAARKPDPPNVDTGEAVSKSRAEQGGRGLLDAQARYKANANAKERSST